MQWHGLLELQKTGDAFNEKNCRTLLTHSGGGGAKGLQAMRIHVSTFRCKYSCKKILTTYENL